jgi:hypothetical protein
VLVQVQAPGFKSAVTTSATLNETAGNLVVAAVYWDQAPNTVTLTDSAGLAWIPLTPYETPGGTGCGGTTGNASGAQLYYAQVTVTGANTVTVTQTSGTQPLGVMLLEYAGIATVDPVDVTSGQLAPAASNQMIVPAMTTSSPGVIVAFFNDTVGSGMMGGDASYILEARDVGFPNMIEDAIVPPGTYMPTGTLPGAQIDACWIATAVALKAR